MIPVKKLIIYLFAGILCLVSAMGQDGGVQVELLEQEITGLALYPDGQTPVADMPVRVWNVDAKKIIFRGRTGRNGSFSIPRLEAGNNYLFVGRVRVNLRIFKPAPDTIHQSHDIIMVVSRGMVVPAKPNVMEVIMAPAIMKPPEDPPVISP